MNDDWLLRRGDAAIAAHSRAWIEGASWMIHAGSANARHTQLAKRGPIADQDIGVHHRHFYGVRDRFFLRFRNFGHQSRNQGVVAGQNTIARAHRMNSSRPRIRDPYRFGFRWGAIVLYSHN